MITPTLSASRRAHRCTRAPRRCAGRPPASWLQVVRPRAPSQRLRQSGSPPVEIGNGVGLQVDLGPQEFPFDGEHGLAQASSVPVWRRRHRLQAGRWHLSIRSVPGLDQGPQPRQHRGAVGAQREVEQVRPALGFHRDDRWLRRETGATRRGPTTTDRVSLQTIDESWRQSRWKSTAKLCCRSVSRLQKEIAHARTADSGGYHRSVLGMQQPLESDSAMAPPRRPGDRPLRGGEPKWPRSPKIRDLPKDIAKCSKSWQLHVCHGIDERPFSPGNAPLWPA
jgi:hypothetical protein